MQNRNKINKWSLKDVRNNTAIMIVIVSIVTKLQKPRKRDRG